MMSCDSLLPGAGDLSAHIELVEEGEIQVLVLFAALSGLAVTSYNQSALGPCASSRCSNLVSVRISI